MNGLVLGGGKEHGLHRLFADAGHEQVHPARRAGVGRAIQDGLIEVRYLHHPVFLRIPDGLYDLRVRHARMQCHDPAHEPLRIGRTREDGPVEPVDVGRLRHQQLVAAGTAGKELELAQHRHIGMTPAKIHARG